MKLLTERWLNVRLKAWPNVWPNVWPKFPSGQILKPQRIIVLILVVGLDAHAQETEGLPHGFDAGWKGMKTCTLLYETSEVRVGQCSFAPGVGHEKHYHNPHFGYVIEGSTMLIQDAGGERELTTEAGDTWSTDTITVHEAVNSGTTTARYLIIEPRPGRDPASVATTKPQG